MKSLETITLPLISGVSTTGCELCGKRLIESRLLENLRSIGVPVENKGEIPCRIVERREGHPRLYNADLIHHELEKLTSLLPNILGAESLKLFLGGDCVITLATLASLRKLGETNLGMLWLDAHGDYNTPETTPSGFIGGMCLAFANGLGPEMFSRGFGHSPLVDPTKTVLVGCRDLDPLEKELNLAKTGVRIYPANELAGASPHKRAKEIADYLTERTKKVVIHLDVDVIDPSEIPAVNYPTAGGLGLKETTEMLAAVANSVDIAAFEVASYCATKDLDNSSASRIVNLIVEVVKQICRTSSTWSK